MSEAYLTLEQAAKRAEVSKKTIRRWIKLGLPTITLNSRMQRIRVEVFDRWLREFEGSLTSPGAELNGLTKMQVIDFLTQGATVHMGKRRLT